MKSLKNSFESIGYFTSLPEKTKELVKELILKAADEKGGPDCYKSDEEAIESIECHSRDGFSPFSHNKGGLVYQNFTDLMGYFGGGYTCTHEGAAKEIQRQIDYSLKLCAEDTYAKFITKFQALGIEEKDVSYGTIERFIEKGHDMQDVLNYIQEHEYDCLGGTEDTIMHEIRFMYHGQEGKEHSASVSAAVNTEGPYHRSSISWAPGVFCEGAKEVEITWTTQTELKKKLTAALKKVSKAVF